MFYMVLVTTIFRSKNWKCSPVIFASLHQIHRMLSVYFPMTVSYSILYLEPAPLRPLSSEPYRKMMCYQIFSCVCYIIHRHTLTFYSVHTVTTNYLIMSAMLMKSSSEIVNTKIGCSIAFFITLLRNHGANVIVPSLVEDDQNENLIFILKYIQEHFATVTLKELSSFFNYSERQLQRIIKSSTGMSFSENIQQLRMNQATRLLANPDISIAVISEELGYSDIGNFRQAFKKCFGMTPLEYRNKTR